MTPLDHLTPEERERAVLEMLAEIHDRKLAGEIVAKVCAVTSLVSQNGRPGKVTVTLDIKPMGEGKVMIDAKVGSKAPDAVQRAAVFYTTENGELMREDPRQGHLDYEEAGPRILTTEKPRRAAAGE